MGSQSVDCVYRFRREMGHEEESRVEERRKSTQHVPKEIRYIFIKCCGMLARTCMPKVYCVGSMLPACVGNMLPAQSHF